MTAAWTWKRGPFCIGDPGSWYNGWDWDQRCAVTPVQKIAVASGDIVQPTECGMTGHSSGYVFMHTEDYERPLEFYPLARFAHSLLHQRFTDPLPWNALVRANYAHGAWFTFLTMDPRDMRRSFGQVYPQGLPRAGECWPALADRLGLTPSHFAATALEAAALPLAVGNIFKERLS